MISIIINKLQHYIIVSWDSSNYIINGWLIKWRSRDGSNHGLYVHLYVHTFKKNILDYIFILQIKWLIK